MTGTEDGGAGAVDDHPSPRSCAQVLADAFAREPAVSWICSGAAVTRPHWFAATLDTQAALPGARRHLLTAPGGEPLGAAVLTAPGEAPSPAAQAQWTARVLTRCGPRALARTLRYLRTAESGAPPGAWTLEFVGVTPAAAGRGHGRRLLDHLLSGAPGADGVFLTTADPAHVQLYQRFGFRLLRRTAVGPLDVAALYRPAGTRPGDRGGG